jgi:hypothetical protein
MLLDGFIFGLIATTSLVAALFFLRFWHRTRDLLFAAFALAFLFQGGTAIAMVYIHDANPDSFHSWMYVTQLCTYLLILAAILRKNRGAK